jgi:spore maturation protein SpmB
VLKPLQFPPDLLPLALMRPLSGSATLAILTDIIHRLGPDNIVSLMAATIYGSTETTFYVAAVYFGSVAVKQTRHAIQRVYWAIWLGSLRRLSSAGRFSDSPNFYLASDLTDFLSSACT